MALLYYTSLILYCLLICSSLWEQPMLVWLVFSKELVHYVCSGLKSSLLWQLTGAYLERQLSKYMQATNYLPIPGYAKTKVRAFYGKIMFILIISETFQSQLVSICSLLLWTFSDTNGIGLCPVYPTVFTELSNLLKLFTEARVGKNIRLLTVMYVRPQEHIIRWLTHQQMNAPVSFQVRWGQNCSKKQRL